MGVFLELDFCSIQFPFVSFVFPKTEVSEVGFMTLTFSLETFYKTKCGIRK